MTLIVGIHARNSIILGAEQEEVSGFTSKKTVEKLKLYTDSKWALGFGGAGDAAIIDGTERRLSDWLDTKAEFSQKELCDALEDILAEIHTKFIDPDPKSEGISIVVGASCSDGLVLIKSQKRVAQIVNDYACSGYGADIASYLLERLYEADDNWIDAVQVAAFSVYEVKNSTQYCGGDTNFLVLQPPPRPRWRQLGRYFSVELENDLQGLIHELRSKLTNKDQWRPELENGYSDELHPDGLDLKELEGFDEVSAKKRLAEAERLRKLDD